MDLRSASSQHVELAMAFRSVNPRPSSVLYLQNESSGGLCGSVDMTCSEAEIPIYTAYWSRG
jgi:hypothetical protein